MKKIRVFMDCMDFVGRSIAPHLKDYEFTYHYTKSRSKFNYVNDFFEVRDMLRSGKLDNYDVIHINNWFNFLLIKYRKPHQIWIAESHGFHVGLGSWDVLKDSELYIKLIGAVFNLLFYYPMRNSIKKFDVYLVSIPWLLKRAKEIRTDAAWLNNPVEDYFFKEKKNFRRNMRMEGNPSIFYPTRLHRVKSPEKAFELFDKILLKYPGAKLHLISYEGQYSQYRVYDRFLKKHRENIVWHSLYKRDKLALAYKSSDIVLGDFNRGLLNMVELEAMASGAAVVSLDKYEFIKMNLEDLNKLALRLLEDRKFRAEYIRRSKKYVRDYHSTREVSKMFRSIVSRFKKPY